jgi:hypothetical protein
MRTKERGIICKSKHFYKIAATHMSLHVDTRQPLLLKNETTNFALLNGENVMSTLQVAYYSRFLKYTLEILLFGNDTECRK